MKEARPKRIIKYKTVDGKVPYDLWLADIKDKARIDAIDGRIERVKRGNLGDCKSLEEGIHELRFKAFGIRIYFAEIAGYIVLLLCAGDKSSQSRDIKKAQEYWREFNSRMEES